MSSNLGKKIALFKNYQNRRQIWQPYKFVSTSKNDYFVIKKLCGFKYITNLQKKISYKMVPWVFSVFTVLFLCAKMAKLSLLLKRGNCILWYFVFVVDWLSIFENCLWEFSPIIMIFLRFALRLYFVFFFYVEKRRCLLNFL